MFPKIVEQGDLNRGEATVYGGGDHFSGKIFYTLREAQVLIEEWRQHYNRVRPHSALGYRPPAPETTAARLTMESRIGEDQKAA